ncbi:hypothetical protein COCON_G00040980 [Conger conger]|uniref:PARP catalytic domain-containing protein n=1 Tax=Conger conger TaxID=82655 RepID=A0A9Q1I3V7_CONCO|nr:hypothetical protein COCON_G00040980 [Conger conger]
MTSPSMGSNWAQISVKQMSVWMAELHNFLQSSSEPEEGHTYVMYHGTSRQAAEQIKAHGFHQSSDGMLGRGVYASRDVKKARAYPRGLPADQCVVLKLRVNVGRVMRIDYQGHPLQKTWHEHGYDTAWCPPRCGMVPSDLEEECVWDPDRVEVMDVLDARAASGVAGVSTKAVAGAITVVAVTVAAVTVGAITLGAVTAGATGAARAITARAVTMGPVARAITSRAVTSRAVTSRAVTMGAFTARAVTSRAVGAARAVTVGAVAMALNRMMFSKNFSLKW